MKTEYGLGRLPAIDHRDRKFLAAKPRVSLETRTSRHWITAKALDQGDTSQCVAYAWEQYLASSPVKNKFYKQPALLYDEAQKLDEWEGENYAGTSVRGGAKALQTAGYISEYNWAFDVDTAVKYIIAKGPIVIGTSWDDSMFYPFDYGKRKETFIRRGGPVVGGHAYLGKGVNLKIPCFCGTPGAIRIMNSWSELWGDGGKAWMCLKEFGTLIEDFGEVCMASELKFEATQSETV